VPKIRLVAAALATLVLVSGCAPSSGSVDPADESGESLSQQAEPETAAAPARAEFDGKSHYDGDWDAWFAAGTPDNGEFSLFDQWRTPEKDAAGVNYLETDDNALGYSAECDNPASQNCLDVLSGFASLCQQLYDQAPSMLSLMSTPTNGVKDPMRGMLAIYCPEVLDTFGDY